MTEVNASVAQDFAPFVERDMLDGLIFNVETKCYEYRVAALALSDGTKFANVYVELYFENKSLKRAILQYENQGVLYTNGLHADQGSVHYPEVYEEEV